MFTRAVTSDVHHEGTTSFCKSFQAHISSHVRVFEDHGNPFKDTALTTVNSSRFVLPDECSQSVISAYEIGKKQFNTFVKDCLVLRKVCHDVIKRNNFSSMSRKKILVWSKDKQKIVDLEKGSTLFAKLLYLGSQARQMNVNEFFGHEFAHRPYPRLENCENLLRSPT
jgi:hypothetical protein